MTKGFALTVRRMTVIKQELDLVDMEKEFQK